MSPQVVTITKATLESYRDKWQQEKGFVTVGDVRDRIADMCLEQHIAIGNLPPSLREHLDQLRRYNIRDAARMETLLEAAEQSMEEVEA